MYPHNMYLFLYKRIFLRTRFMELSAVTLYTFHPCQAILGCGNKRAPVQNRRDIFAYGRNWQQETCCINFYVQTTTKHFIR